MDDRPLHPFEQQLARAWPPAAWNDLTVLVAVSGGADSVALLRALRALSARPSALWVGHFNHRLRGAGSDGDEAFVCQLCARLEVPFVSARDEQLRISGSGGGEGLEAAARTARYSFLTQAAEQAGARYVAMAHTADDQAETILHRIVRGTGLAGLAGIPRARQLSPAVTVIRPLLEMRRADVIQYLHDRSQDCREDASNTDSRFTRNRIRHELMPLLADLSPRAGDAVTRLGGLAGEAQQALETLVLAPLLERAVTTSGGRITIELAALSGYPRYIVRELLVSLWKSRHWPLQQMGFEEWEALAAMAGQADQPRRIFPGKICVERQADALILTPMP